MSLSYIPTVSTVACYCYLVTCDMIKHYYRCLFELFLEVTLVTHGARMFYMTTLCTVDNSAEMQTFRKSAIERHRALIQDYERSQFAFTAKTKTKLSFSPCTTQIQ